MVEPLISQPTGLAFSPLTMNVSLLCRHTHPNNQTVGSKLFKNFGPATVSSKQGWADEDALRSGGSLTILSKSGRRIPK